MTLRRTLPNQQVGESRSILPPALTGCNSHQPPRHPRPRGMTASNQLSNYGDVQTGTHPARRDPDRRSIRTQGRRPSLLRDEEVSTRSEVSAASFGRAVSVLFITAIQGQQRSAAGRPDRRAPLRRSYVRRTSKLVMPLPRDGSRAVQPRSTATIALRSVSSLGQSEPASTRLAVDTRNDSSATFETKRSRRPRAPSVPPSIEPHLDAGTTTRSARTKTRTASERAVRARPITYRSRQIAALGK
jgi:hypothetical protein